MWTTGDHADSTKSSFLPQDLQEARTIPEVRGSIFDPFEVIIRKISKAFESSAGDVLRLRGFVVPVFILRNPEHIARVFGDPRIGIRKKPSVMPRFRSMLPRSLVAHS